MAKLLDVQQLAVTFALGTTRIHAVAGIDFSVARGETFCLVGESGSGKSVTALALLGLLPAHGVHCTGQAWFQRRDADIPEHRIELLGANPVQRQRLRGGRLAMIFQEPMTSLNPVLTVGEQLIEALALHRPDLPPEHWRQAAIQALHDVQLPQPEQRVDDFPHRLSGGQRQRVMIAMAIACRPDLLIADEPTTALDVTVQAEILRLLGELQRQIDMGIVLITHDFGVVAQVADRVAVMRDGRIVEQADKTSILYQPGVAYTRQLLAALPENLTPPSRGPIAAAPEPLLRVTELAVHFPVRKGFLRRTVDRIKAVDGVDLAIQRGQVLALVGESGCGKTTLGRAILRLLKPSAGRIRFAGQDLQNLSNTALRPVRKRLQVAFQDPASALNPRLRVVTALLEPLRVHGLGEDDQARLARARHSLEQVQLSADYLWRYPHELSGGQRQRIGIARALVLEPDLLVCDEITSALDVSIQAQILTLLLDLQRQTGLTMLFITHDIGVVEYVSDETAVMYNGRIVERGPTDRVCRQPQAAYTQKLLAAVPRVMQ